MRRTRHVMAAAASAALAVGAATAFTAPASAAAQATYGGQCGSGYAVVNSAPIGSAGTVYLTYNRSSGKNCAVTIRTTTGAPVDMFIQLYVPGNDELAEDFGAYRSYAGPVYAYGKGLCVDWGGGIANQSTWTYDSNCASLKEHRITSTG
jgi:hypothetical protein